MPHAKDPSIVGYTVIEFCGTGDPFFEGSADDRPLGTSGFFLRSLYAPTDVARFETREAALSAASAAPKRPGSKVAAIAVRDYSRLPGRE